MNAISDKTCKQVSATFDIDPLPPALTCVGSVPTNVCYIWPSLTCVGGVPTSVCYIWPPLTCVGSVPTNVCYIWPLLTCVGSVPTNMFYIRIEFEVVLSMWIVVFDHFDCRKLRNHVAFFVPVMFHPYNVYFRGFSTIWNSHYCSNLRHTSHPLRMVDSNQTPKF